MDKRLAACVVIMAALICLGFIAAATLEIYPRQVSILPSRNAIFNDYFALERWLAETGHPVRVVRGGKLSRLVSGAEQAVVVRASACDWKDAAAILGPWIERGGFLLISVDHDFEDGDLAAFLASGGISLNPRPAGEDAEAGALADIDDPADESSFPDFDRNVRFFTVEPETAPEKIVSITDPTGAVRMARVQMGAGALAVTGRLRFMFNRCLDREINARLAWDLTGARTSAANPGLLFVREKRVTKGFLGNIAGRGNIFPLAASALLLVIIGFWMVIPAFGLRFSEVPNRTRPVRERFLAEIRFLKKYGALGSYLETYVRELELRGMKGHEELAEIEQALQSGHLTKYRDIINGLRKLESLMERV
jgi:hypothetical protein